VSELALSLTVQAEMSAPPLPSISIKEFSIRTVFDIITTNPLLRNIMENLGRHLVDEIIIKSSQNVPKYEIITDLEMKGETKEEQEIRLSIAILKQVTATTEEVMIRVFKNALRTELKEKHELLAKLRNENEKDQNMKSENTELYN